MLLVTGANGQLAKSVITHLLEMRPAADIAVCSRNPDGAYSSELRALGVDVRLGDFDRPETMAAAMQGVEKALIISTYSTNDVRLGQNLAALEAAKAAGVGHVAYTSFLGAGPDAQAEHSQLVHYPTEQAIRASGLDYTILRHAIYADVNIADLDETLASGLFRRPGGAAACAYVARVDLGRSAACVLAQDGHANRIYSETMERSYSGDDLAALISEVYGKPVGYEAVAAEDWADYMHRAWGVPMELTASAIGSMRALEQGEFDIVSHDYAAITGAPPRDFRQFLLDAKAANARA